MMPKKNDAIEMKLTPTWVHTRWPCHVCGGRTERVGVLVEGRIKLGGEDFTLRVCEQCLEAADIDGRLAEYAAWLSRQAIITRSLIGRLRVPTYAEWEAACSQKDDEDRRRVADDIEVLDDLTF